MMQGQSQAGADNLSLRSVAPVDLRVRDLNAEFENVPPTWRRVAGIFLPAASKSKQQHLPKRVLDKVSADMPAGSLTAIIGGSGSGKTTLLNVISRRVSDRRLHVQGTITYNGDADITVVRNAYVMQQDVHLPTLTVRETLQYAADLRLPPPSTKEERRGIVEQVILELGLKECADTRMGSAFVKGCSGGEKRRTSIGVQLLSNPSVLFCDEPTTGLDAYSAFQVIETLKKLAEKGRTIVISIHSPRSEIWSLFDRFILLSRGVTLFSGLRDSSIRHFRRCGYELPPFVNPAEFLIDLAAVDNRSEAAEKSSEARVRALSEAWHTRSEDEESAAPGPVVATRRDRTDLPRLQAVGFIRQLQILTTRTFKVTIRDPFGIAGTLLEAVAMSVICGWIFLQLSMDLAGIRSRQGSLYNASALQGYLILLFETYRLTMDIQLFDRERKEGVVSVPAFLLSRRLARLFLEDLPVPVIFSLIYYFMIGFRPEAATFFIFLTIMIISQYLAVSMATLCVAISRQFAVASLIANLNYTVQALGCAFFVNADQIPVYTAWIRWTAYNFYILGAMLANEFVGVNGGEYGQFYDCPASDNPEDPECIEYRGTFILESFGFPLKWIWRPIVVSAAFAILYYIGAAVVLILMPVEMELAKARPKDLDSSQGNLEDISSTRREGRQVTIELCQYELEVHTRRLHHLGKATKSTILRPVSTTFEPGKINVIMGPSGSGKTSLLQSMARRLRNSWSSSFRASGDLTLNGATPSQSVLRSIVSFVTQDDDALLSSLTVRETLRFAAGLRLPPWVSKQEKFQRAESVILQMGLKDCADNVVGSEFKKGISGGEKRRTSIAIQILTDPKVILLDEPTSGLDAFTAMSIIQVLKALATEGRTVIMTIHQARSDFFGSFDNILLLTRGGSQAYSGSGKAMLPHFRSLGFQCPAMMNPADFALDLITIDLQHEDKEAESRLKVERIVQSWQSTTCADRSKSTEIATPAELSSFRKEMNPFRITFPLVLQRSALNLSRRPDIVLAKTTQVISIGVIFTLFFAPLQSNFEAVQSRMGFVQEFCALYFVGMLQNLSLYPFERDVFNREEADGCYNVEVFILSYTLLEIPFSIISSLVYGVLAAYACNLERSAKMFGLSAFNCFAIITCGESIGIMFCTFFSHIGFSVNMMSVVLSIANVMGGVLSLNIPSFLQAMNHLSPLKYSVANLAPYSMHGRTFTCHPDQEIHGQCPITTGEQVLELYNLNKDADLNLLALGVATILYRMVAYGVVKIAKTRWEFDGLARVLYSIFGAFGYIASRGGLAFSL